MADNTIDPTTLEAQNQALAAQADLTTKASDALKGFSDVANMARGVFNGFQLQLDKLGISFKNNYELTQQQSQALGLLSTAILGTRTAFDQLGNVDTSYLNTFTGQFKDLQNIMESSPGTKAAKEASDALIGTLIKQGAPLAQLQAAAKGGTSILLGFAKSFFESADNALRLQNAYVQLSAQTGNLQKVFSAAGTGLDKINLLLVQQQKAVTDTAAATQLPIQAVEHYYAALGTIPGALESTVKSGTDADANVSTLTAAIQYAAGSGRSFKEVVDDLKVAFEDYNLTGERALRFTARMGELSNKFGTQLSDVRKFLTGTAEAFKKFGDESEGAAKMVNEYLGALKQTGISGTVALDVMNDLTAGIKNMGIAQKAFISAQSGGPGGLMGAFQIEKLLREGKIDEVFEKVRQQMTKQFGQIVTLEEASKSPQAAAALTRQMMTLRQGPLGQFARDDQSAIRLLEAFRTRGEGRTGAITELSGKITQDTMKTGVDLQQKSVTELSRIRAILESTRGVAAVSNLGLAQQGLTAGVGTPIEGADAAAEFRDTLNETMTRSANESGRTVAGITTDLQTKVLQDKTGEFAIQIADEYSKLFSEFGLAVKAPATKIRNLLKSGDVEDANKEAAKLVDDIVQRKSLTKQIGTVPKLDLSDLTPPGTQLGTAATGAANLTAGGAGTTLPTITRPGGPVAHTPTVTTGGQLGEITVHVEGYCLECGERMKGTTQSTALNVGQRARKS